MTGPLTGMLLLGLLGCPAEMLGVELPKGGAEALRQEDLSRDVWELSQLGDRSQQGDAQQRSVGFIVERMQQMKLAPAFDGEFQRDSAAGPLVCGVKRGQKARAVVVAALDGGEGASASAGQVAMLISLAKAFDVPQAPAQTLVFCSLPADGGLDAYLGAPALPVEQTSALLALGPVTGATLTPTPGERAMNGGALRTLTLSSGPDPVHGTADDQPTRLDYRQLLRNTVRALDALEALPELRPGAPPAQLSWGSLR